MESGKVRHIPIFVEGRDEPIINTGHDVPQSHAQPEQQNHSSSSAFASADSSSGSMPFDHLPKHHQSFPRPPMGFDDSDMDIGFGSDMRIPAGSIFDRAKNFPVKDFFNMRSSASPRRSESPVQQQTRSSPSPAQTQARRESTPNNHQAAAHQIPVQHEAKCAPSPQPQQAPTETQQQPEVDLSMPEKQKAIEDSIMKIQKIQASVLDLMSSVEKYDGSNKKEYAYLDEMLTQNLLKLDDIDAEGKENIKNARREAIKCINSLISLLEAKKDEAIANKSEAKAEADIVPNGLVGTSKNSSYDNVNVQQTSSNNSVNMVDTSKEVPSSAEASLEAKVQAAVQKQDEQNN